MHSKKKEREGRSYTCERVQRKQSHDTVCCEREHQRAVPMQSQFEQLKKIKKRYCDSIRIAKDKADTHDSTRTTKPTSFATMRGGSLSLTVSDKQSTSPAVVRFPSQNQLNVRDSTRSVAYKSNRYRQQATTLARQCQPHRRLAGLKRSLQSTVEVQ